MTLSLYSRFESLLVGARLSTHKSLPNNRFRPEANCTSSYKDKIPDVVMVISFGRVLWMVEKSGADMNDLLPGTTGSRHRMAMRCARNIVRWWVVEFRERAPGNSQLSYPGEVAMPQGLMPIALYYGSAYANKEGYGGPEEGKESSTRVSD